MPRLLLVDDNPSIHRIAESLLAPTDVELVCVDSAAEALDRIGRGERFDVALVDTAMPGMDGWTLLSRLRALEATAAMPIALMAGVLDPVDPAKLARAPIQGFLKKPIELRELGERVKTLLTTPVVPPAAPSAFSTVPATPARDLIQRAEIALPEFRPEPIVAAPVEEPAAQVLPEPEPVPVPEPEDDLLVLTVEDLWPEEAPLAETGSRGEELPEVHLELEELDLESLQDLAVEAPPAPGEQPAPKPPAVEPPMGLEPHALETGFADDALVTLSGLEEADDALVTLSGLEELDLGPMLEPEPRAFLPDGVPAEAAAAMPLPAEPERVSQEGVVAPLEELPVGFPPLEPEASAQGGWSTASGSEVSSLVAEVLSTLDLPVAPLATHALEAAAGGQLPAASGQAVSFAEPSALSPAPLPVPPSMAIPAAGATAGLSSGDGQAQAVIQAILADPVLVDALVKAVVARMGDQAIREIAWEVMPDLAGRLHS